MPSEGEVPDGWKAPKPSRGSCLRRKGDGHPPPARHTGGPAHEDSLGSGASGGRREVSSLNRTARRPGCALRDRGSFSTAHGRASRASRHRPEGRETWTSTSTASRHARACQCCEEPRDKTSHLTEMTAEGRGRGVQLAPALPAVDLASARAEIMPHDRANQPPSRRAAR